MTFEEKSAIVISQLRADRDRLQDAIDKIRAEIEQITDTMGVSYNQYVSKIDVLQIIDKHMAEVEQQETDIPMEYFESGGK